MLYKEYGKTGKKVSAIGFGGMRFRRADYADGNFERAAEVVREASRLGINYFDTAPLYCDNLSEEIFGEAFRDMPNPYYVATKSDAYDYDGVMFSLERSLKRMGIDKIHFFQMWNVIDLKKFQRFMDGGAYKAMVKAKEEGLIEHICFSAHASGEEIEQIINMDLFEGVLLGYNALNFKYRQQGLLAAKRKKIGVATMNPLGGGIIPQNPDSFAFLKELGGGNAAKGALRFNASHEEISVVLCGLSDIGQVREAVDVGGNVGEVSDKRRDELAENLSKSLDTLCTGCGYCVGCPVDIEIPKYMDSYNMALITSDEQKVLSRMKWHWEVLQEKAGECIACGACEAKCTQHLPIIERLKQIAKIQPAVRK